MYNADVFSKTAFLYKAPPTNVARESLLSSVGHHVIFDLSGYRKYLAAHVARVLFLTTGVSGLTYGKQTCN